MSANPTEKLRIVYILPELKIGGTETQVLYLARGLRTCGHEVRLLCLFREGRLADRAREYGIPLETLHAKNWGPGVMVRIQRSLAAQPADVVHTFLFGFHFFAGLPARKAGARLILSSRRGLELDQPWKIHFIEKLGNTVADHVVANAEAVRLHFMKREGLACSKTSTLYNGVDMERFQPGRHREMIRRELGIEDGVPLVGTVANFSAPKGYPDLIAAAERVLRERPGVRFVFAGDGPLWGSMQEMVRQKGLEDRILFTGSRRDIPDFLAALDVFVFGSLWEGMPNVVMEAMAMEKPIAATPAGGIPELIDHGQNGLLVPLRNPEAMAAALFKLLDDPAYAAALGRSARKKIEQVFTLPVTVEAHEVFYRKQLNPEKCPEKISPAGVS